MRNALKWLPSLALAAIFTISWQLWSSGQQPGAEKSNPDKSQKSGTSNRLEFEIVHSFDGKYLGDTPGHMGRAGGLTSRRPRIALGDRVYRGDELVGLITSLDWNRTNNSLDIEFDPVDHARVCVGDPVWVVLDNPSPRKSSEPQRVQSTDPQP
jgi:hypothetical protein